MFTYGRKRRLIKRILEQRRRRRRQQQYCSLGGGDGLDEVVVVELASFLKALLDETGLKTLLKVLESEGLDNPGACVRSSSTKTSSIFGLVVLCCKVFRGWNTVAHIQDLKKLIICQTDASTTALCCNPYHWSLRFSPVIPSSPPLNNHRLRLPDSKIEVSSSSSSLSSIVSYSTSGSRSRYGLDDKGNPLWCKLAYWEECVRVGPQYPVFASSVDVFSDFCKGSGFALSNLFTQNQKPSLSTLDVRKKIGQGLLLSQESEGVWIYNRSSYSVFVNSPTLEPVSEIFITHKLPPGHSLLIFDFEKCSLSSTKRKKQPSSSSSLDVMSVKVSFAKGWGTNYKRQNVTNCPCWLEIMLLPRDEKQEELRS